MKLHHAVLDGPSGAELMVQLLDLVPTPSVGAPSPVALRPDADPTAADLKGVARRRAARGAARAAAGVRHIADVAAATSRWDLSHPADAARLPGPAPRTLFNRPVTARRTVRSLSVPLDRIDDMRRGTESTVNDAVLAITGGALRRYLRRHRALPASPLVALVPTSLRHGQPATGGNHTSALYTTLGTDIADPAARLAAVTRVTSAAKRRHDEAGLDTLVQLTDLVPPRAAQTLNRLAGRIHLAAWGPLAFNIVVSNVPGPDVPLYLNGAVVESAVPMGPVTDWSAINITVVSYRRQLVFGIVACPDVIPDIDEVVGDLLAELASHRLTATAS
jgi:diacylglycerol O-acyltransferase